MWTLWSGGTGFEKPSRHSSWFIHCTGVICENYPTLSMYNWDTAVCVHCWYQEAWWKFKKKLMFAGALSLFQSFKGGTNGFPGSMVMLWDMGSPFYSKWAVMQWTHPSSLRATKCKVCHMLEGCCIYIVCCRSHQHCIHTLRSKSECDHMLWHAMLNALGY